MIRGSGSVYLRIPGRRMRNVLISLRKNTVTLRTVTLRENYRSSPQILECGDGCDISGKGWSRRGPGREPAGGKPMSQQRTAGTSPQLSGQCAGPVDPCRQSDGRGCFLSRKRSTVWLAVSECWRPMRTRGRGGERRVRGFDEIAVLCRTHHQGGTGGEMPEEGEYSLYCGGTGGFSEGEYGAGQYLLLSAIWKNRRILKR